MSPLPQEALLNQSSKTCLFYLASPCPGWFCLYFFLKRQKENITETLLLKTELLQLYTKRSSTRLTFSSYLCRQTHPRETSQCKHVIFSKSRPFLSCTALHGSCNINRCLEIFDVLGSLHAGQWKVFDIGVGGRGQGGITVDECYKPELSSWWVRDHVKQGPFEKLRSLECHSYIFNKMCFLATRIKYPKLKQLPR